MRPPDPIHVTQLFPPLLDRLLDLLRGLAPDEWQRPTACTGWSVHDVTLHLLGGEMGILSRQRDGHMTSFIPVDGWEELVALINRANAGWVETMRRLSPRLTVDLLELTGRQTAAYFATVDPDSLGAVVDWAGSEPAPNWLDLAREYTERWHHQQHIRDAVGQPGAMEPELLAPVLAAFAHALPRTYRAVDAPVGTTVTLTVPGPAGGRWTIRREASGWTLYAGAPAAPDAVVTLPADAAWRRFTNGLTPAQTREHAILNGDQRLGARLLETIAIIA